MFVSSAAGEALADFQKNVQIQVISVMDLAEKVR